MKCIFFIKQRIHFTQTNKMNTIKLSKKTVAKKNVQASSAVAVAAPLAVAVAAPLALAVASPPAVALIIVKIVRETFAKPLIDIINLDVFDNEAERGISSDKEYQIPTNQRFPRWEKKNWEKLVDSVMQDYPMSSLLMTQHSVKVGVNFIHDGQTRLSILQDYLKNKFTWNNKLYQDLSEVERSRFNNYSVRVELIKKKPSTSDGDFKNICRAIFERINSGKPLTDNDKYHNCLDEPVLQFIMKELKFHPQLLASLKKIFGDIGGGKSRTGLANMVGCVLALATNNGDCITPSYNNNSHLVMSDSCDDTTIQMSLQEKERVFNYFGWYIQLVNDFKETNGLKRTPGFLRKISGPLALTLIDWIDGLATDRTDMWLDFISKIHADKNYEKRVCKDLEKGVTANNSAVNFRKRIQCVVSAYEKKRNANANSNAEENDVDTDDAEEYESSEENFDEEDD